MTSRKPAEGQLSSFGSEETQQNGEIVHTYVKNSQKYSWIDVNCLEYLPKTVKICSYSETGKEISAIILTISTTLVVNTVGSTSSFPALVTLRLQSSGKSEFKF